MKICFGIVSWLPDEQPARKLREERVNRLLKQVEILWHCADVLVIAQNWKSFKPAKTACKLDLVKFDEGLGILRARKTLRAEFLKRDYDYMILFDDDAIIEAKPGVAQDYIEAIKQHPEGFCFQRGSNSKYHPYAGAQLNLCAISRWIWEREDIPDVDPQQSQGYEDSVFACLLHWKYASHEFLIPDGIKCVQWMNKNERAPSTWSRAKCYKWKLMNERHDMIQEYISKHRELPNLQVLYEHGVCVGKSAPDKLVQKRIEEKKGKKAYLYF